MLAWIDDIFDRLPFSKGFFLVVVAIVLFFANLKDPEVMHQSAIADWQSTIDERKAKVEESIASLEVTDEGLLACIRKAARDRASIHPTSSGGIDDVRELEVLFCPGSNIYKLNGIGELTRLKSVDFSKNYIRKLSPLQKHPRLGYLHLANNPLEGIWPVKSMPMLKELYLPNLPKISCLEIAPLVKGIKSNYSSIACRGPRGATSSLSTSSMQAKAKKSTGGANSNKLTSAQQQELLEYERATRHKRNN